MARGGDKVLGFDIHKTEIPSASGTTMVPLPHPYVGKLSGKLSADVKIGGQSAAVLGSQSVHNDGSHMRLPGTVRFTSEPSKKGFVTGGTAASVKINGKEAALIGSTVTSCNDMGMRENSLVMAPGGALPMPCIIHPKNTEEYLKEREEDGGKAPEFTAARWASSSVRAGEEAGLFAQTRGMGEGSFLSFQVWREGDVPASGIALARFSSAVSSGSGEAKWIFRQGGGVPPREDPRFFFTVHSAWCPVKRSPLLTVRLARPCLENPEWRDARGEAVSSGCAGEALSLTVSVSSDSSGKEENVSVVFFVYPSGANPLRDEPLARVDAAARGGSASAEWTYVYRGFADGVLERKPKFFFTAEMERCRKITGPSAEFSQKMRARLVDSRGEPLADFPFELYRSGKKEMEGTTAEDGLVAGGEFIPGEYELLLKPKEVHA
jgi:uncharacterized Zn-binding protein involved in type VI secretion